MNHGRLYAEVRAVADIGDDVVTRMWLLFDQHYADVSHETFLRDLKAKDHVFLLRERGTGLLCGFSTVQSYERTVHGRRVRIVYSGDTICDPRYWGQRALHGAFLRYVLRVKLAHPLAPVYWFLISKGYKTFLLLARNFPEYWPRPERATPAWHAALLDALASEKFGEAWRRDRGILTFERPAGRLRPEVAPTGDAERADPLIAFFAARNPGAPAGEELCCLGRIGIGLALNYARRRLLRAMRPAVRRSDAPPLGGTQVPAEVIRMSSVERMR